ncbi:Arabinogalactan protein 16, partial [Linum grandiflorum]
LCFYFLSYSLSKVASQEATIKTVSPRRPLFNLHPHSQITQNATGDLGNISAEIMAVSRFAMAAVGVVLMFAIALPAAAQAQIMAPAPAPAATSDGTSIDQGIAYVLMLLALVLTYLIHAAEMPLLSC